MRSRCFFRLWRIETRQLITGYVSSSSNAVCLRLKLPPIYASPRHYVALRKGESGGGAASFNGKLYREISVRFYLQSGNEAEGFNLRHIFQQMYIFCIIETKAVGMGIQEPCHFIKCNFMSHFLPESLKIFILAGRREQKNAYLAHLFVLENNARLVYNSWVAAFPLRERPFFCIFCRKRKHTWTTATVGKKRPIIPVYCLDICLDAFVPTNDAKRTLALTFQPPPLKVRKGDKNKHE